jgi:hypothetical protein
MAKTTKPTGIGCPKCGGPMGVARTTPRAGFVLRRRACLKRKCKGRTTTAERPVGQMTPTNAPPKPTPAISVGQLLKSLGVSTADVLGPVNLPIGGTDARRADRSD